MQSKTFNFIVWLSLIVISGLTISAIFQPPNYPAFDTEAHRGGRALMPENTIAAMKNAVDLGVTGLEMDTHITADNMVVLSHDEYINPLFTLDPDGKEIAKVDAKKLILYKMSYSELKKYDVGSKFYSKFPQQKKVKTYMPLLSELIDSVQTYLKVKHQKQVFYNIETKCSPEGDGLYNPRPDEFVSLLMDVIKSKGILQYVVIQSFDKRTLQIIHKKYPAVLTSYLVDNNKTFEENMSDLGYFPFIYSPAFKLVNADMVKQCHNKNVKVLPWTVNTKEDIEALKGFKVDGIISDYPELLTSLIE
ncbi:glycerophosphodiester phosphodiesterase family protein [Mucilaginibacter sp. AK015]|uniref:glycerophosphodiester phosphodiesterase family protein n=1 Tax=Mucilaginibacter sp. AK015 TaxID=2723072 RepID=UPI00160EC392|nr:glycerophosphodiester phosphodiesterase family protein [Mucilaginibacter sp. AK015]MBB5395052.1 glycerophosphoryl diester phosphodiesterase [Mucilaginibacter sp. AK015]